MNNTAEIQTKIVNALVQAGEASPYKADANEPDPRYQSYGVRMPQKKAIFKAHRKEIRQLEKEEQISLGTALIFSEIGDQQTLGLWILEPHNDYFSPDKFSELDALVRCLYGWSKIDEFCGSLLKQVLLAFPVAFVDLVHDWNQDEDQWLRRASVVLFTRKVAKSGQFTEVALAFCDTLKFAPEDLVRKGVGWCLKDLMGADKDRVLDFLIYLHEQDAAKTIVPYALRALNSEEKTEFRKRIL